MAGREVGLTVFLDASTVVSAAGTKVCVLGRRATCKAVAGEPFPGQQGLQVA